MSNECCLIIKHLDRFPYGGHNKVKFFLGKDDVTVAVSKILSSYWQQWCDDEGIWFEQEVAIVHTGESFTEVDFAECVRDVIKLPVRSEEYNAD
jgi:hypothetical protein